MHSWLLSDGNARLAMNRSPSAEGKNYSVSRAETVKWPIRFDPARDFVAGFPDDSGSSGVKRWRSCNLDTSLLWPGQPPQSHFPQQLALPFSGSGIMGTLKDIVNGYRYNLQSLWTY
jgi:hypothetical protein